MQALAGEATRLAAAYVDSARSIKDRQVEVEEQWHRLQTRASSRRQRLDDALALQRFLNDVRNQAAWLESMRGLIAADEPASDVAGATALVQRHQEHRGELDARASTLDALVQAGSTLISRGHYASQDIQGRLDSLAAQREALQSLWEQRRVQFEQGHELQLFLRDAEQIEGWIAGQEAALQSSELGDSLDSVEALLKRHDECEKALAAQEDKTRAMADTAAALVAAGHAEARLIRARRDSVVTRRADLNQLASLRRAKLQESLRLQQFLRDAGEADTWMAEKMATACDPSYNDPSNLQGKLQGHHSFQGELAANEGRVDAVHSTGQNLIKSGHFASDTIAQRLAGVTSQWDTLRARAADKGLKLNEALQQQQFQRRVEDMSEWCNEVDAALRVADVGRDLSTVTFLLKKHQLLEAEIDGHKERVEAVSAQAKQLIDSGHFQAESIRSAQQALAARYAAFAAPTASRRRQLEDSLRLQQCFRDMDEELAWIAEKEPAALSQNFGRSLMAAQGLLKKHAALQAELAGRQAAIQGVQDTANGLIRGAHFASESIRERLQVLMARWSELSGAVTARKQGLEDALQTHQYYADANEADAWMGEKQPIVCHDDYGKDEDSSQALLRKHEAVEADLRTFSGTIRGLAQHSSTCKNLSPSTAAESATTSPAKGGRHASQATVTAAHVPAGPSELALSVGESVSVLEKQSSTMWLVQSGSETGLVPAAALKELEPRPITPGAELLGVVERQALLDAQYTNLLDAARTRRLRLEESYKLHRLNREMDETEAWLDEREAIALATDLGSDLEHNELLQARFADFQKDLAATEARVAAANQLAGQFLQQGHSSAPAITARQGLLNTHWARLQSEAVQRASSLARMHGVHRFNRDVDEIKSRFSEKDATLSLTDDGRDLAAVEALRRKHTAAMNDLSALEGRVKDLRVEGTQQASLNPECAQSITARVAEVDTYWDQLHHKAAARRQRLEDSLQLQQFLNDHRDLSAWLAGLTGLASNDALATDESGAEALLQQHHELSVSLDAHSEGLRELQRRGQALAARGHYATPEINERLLALQAQLDQLQHRIQDRGSHLHQCHQLQLFRRLADQAEGWVSTREAPLSSDDTSSTLSGVETLRKKHADFEKSLAAQTEKINEVVREADRLVAEGHYDAVGIAGRKDAVLARYDLLVNPICFSLSSAPFASDISNLADGLVCLPSARPARRAWVRPCWCSSSTAMRTRPKHGWQRRWQPHATRRIATLLIYRASCSATRPSMRRLRPTRSAF